MEIEILDQIHSAIDQIESREGVQVFYACESGSRAWGFASTDSDYDVRFLYLRRPDWYRTIDVEDKPDVIERPIDGILDVNGWDLRKALRLLRKSNPPLLEWLGSPIVYREKLSIADKLRTLKPAYYSPRACLHHYLHMAQGNYRDHLKNEIVWRKKYLYVLRPLLAIRWIEQGLGPVPTEFQSLVDKTVEEPSLRSTIADFLELKKNGAELDRGPRIPVISAFIEEELRRLEQMNEQMPKPDTSLDPLNQLFFDALKEAWDT